jgi:hypothetical protein
MVLLLTQALRRMTGDDWNPYWSMIPFEKDSHLGESGAG